MQTLWVEVPFGLVMGYVAASVGESLQHRVFGHRSRWLRTQARRLPVVASFLERIHWSHTVIHHGRTFKKDFVTPFRSAAERECLIATMTTAERRLALRTSFGLKIPLDSYPWFLWLPLLMTLFLGAAFGVAAAVASIFPMLLPPMLSNFVHPLIHRPYEECLGETSGIMKWLMQTAYARAVIRHHWLHHRYPKSNFNLLLVGDLLLGTHRSASADDILEMRAVGIPVD